MQVSQLIIRYRSIILYSIILGILVFALKWMQWKFLIVDHSVELYVGLVAVFFTLLGLWLSTHFTKEKAIIIEKEVPVLASLNEAGIDEQALLQLNLSKREQEVLALLVLGQSNAAIAQHLFLSVSTVKTHVSNLLFKMEVKSRAQAIEKARRLRLTA
jgi:DNA-binding CsgD family transcriptional regulator